MKSTISAIAMALMLSTSAFGAEGLFLTIKTHEVLTLKKVTKTRFEKISQVATGTASLDVINARGTKNLMSQDINEADTQNAVTLEVTGKNILRVVDIKENIDQEVPATIGKSLFGTVKSITIDSQTMEGLYAASMKESGLDALRGLRVLAFGGLLSSKLNTTDMNCKADAELMVCTQDATLVMSVE